VSATFLAIGGEAGAQSQVSIEESQVKLSWATIEFVPHEQDERVITLQFRELKNYLVIPKRIYPEQFMLNPKKDEALINLWEPAHGGIGFDYYSLLHISRIAHKPGQALQITDVKMKTYFCQVELTLRDSLYQKVWIDKILQFDGIRRVKLELAKDKKGGGAVQRESAWWDLTTGEVLAEQVSKGTKI
jgi:hypothetical protein